MRSAVNFHCKSAIVLLLTLRKLRSCLVSASSKWCVFDTHSIKLLLRFTICILARFTP